MRNMEMSITIEGYRIGSSVYFTYSKVTLNDILVLVYIQLLGSTIVLRIWAECKETFLESSNNTVQLAKLQWPLFCFWASALPCRDLAGS